jgi:predicted RNase H-like nuclease
MRSTRWCWHGASSHAIATHDRVAMRSRATRRVLGVDGCPTGWVVVALEDGAVASVEVVDRLAPALARQRVSHVGIDMPVGLVDGLRDTDAAARRELPGRAATVFSTAPASVVAGFRDGSLTTHAEASACCRRVSGQGLSQQAWRLVPKMAEVDDLVAAGAALHEVHPELAFAAIAGEPLPRKRSWPGLQLRRQLLRDLGIELPDRFAGDVAAAPDDVVDAAVCAWVADGLAGAHGPVRQVPERTDQRAHGRPIVITVRERSATGRGELSP